MRGLCGCHVIRADAAPSSHQDKKFTDFEEEVDGSRVVEAGRENHQQVVQQHGSEVQVELNGFVVQLNVGHLSTHKAYISHPWTQVCGLDS